MGTDIEAPRGPGAPAEVKPWIEGLARMGYAAKGVVYLLIGWIAAAAAFGDGVSTGSEGAFAAILRQPFGRILLALVALGLVGYTVWRLVESLLDPERHGTDAKGLVTRGYLFVSAVIHGSLVIAAVEILTGTGEGGDDTKGWTAELMSQPAGRWLVALLGAAVLAAAGYQGYYAVQAKYRRRLRIGELAPEVSRWLDPVARTGLLARGAVFLVIGSFFVVAAWRADPDEAKGLGEALRTLESQPWGPWILVVVAVGLMAYGLYQLFKSKYGVVRP